MNTLDTTHETSSSWSPYKVETKQFLEDAKRETFEHVIKGIIGSSYDGSKVYVLYGCEISGGGPYDITAGAIFCRDAVALANNLPGEIYTVPAVTGITLSGSDVVVANLLNTADPVADPTIFSDNVPHDIHRVRQATFAAGASGSGTLTGNANGDFTNMQPAKPYTFYVTHDTNVVLAGFPISSYQIVHSSLQFTTPDDGVTRNWRIDYKGYYQTDGTPTAAQSGDNIALFAGSTQLDFTEVKLVNTSTTSQYSMQGTVNLLYYGAIPPNTVVQVMAQGFSGVDPIDLANNKLLAVEIR